MRKLMIAVTAVAGVALASGCSKRDNVEQERQDIAEAQQEAAQETAQARQDAQEEMTEAQREAQEQIAGARQDVQEEREDLAQAQRDQQQELAEDQREQQEDMAQGGSGASGASAMQASNVNGRVLSTSGDSLTLVDTSNNKQLELKTNDQTRIMKDNRQVKLDDITEGAQVRASYVMEGKDMVAKELTVTQPVMKKQ